MHVEKPESGRAIIHEEGGALQIIIPKRWNILKVLVILFLFAWLGGWLFGEITAIASLHLGNFNRLPSSSDSFMFFWLIAWTVGGLAVISFILWFFFAKEIINVTVDTLTIENKILNVGRTKRYALSDVKNLRSSQSGAFAYGTLFFSRYNRGSLAFDYGMKTVRFANDIDKAEAVHILNLIKERSGRL